MFKALKHYFATLHRDERGAMSVEKILILAVIALPILIILYAFKNTIIGWFQSQSSQLNTNNSGGGTGTGGPGTGGTGLGP